MLEASHVARVADEATLTHLLERLAIIEAVVAAAVARRRAADPAPDDAFRGLYFAPEELDRLLAPAPPLPARDEQAEQRFAAAEARADAAAEAGADLRLR